MSLKRTFVTSVQAAEQTQILTSRERTPDISTNLAGNSTDGFNRNCPGFLEPLAEEKSTRLKHFIATSTSLKMKVKKVNEDWSLRAIGKFSDEELNLATDEATVMMATQGVGESWF